MIMLNSTDNGFCKWSKCNWFVNLGDRIDH